MVQHQSTKHEVKPAGQGLVQAIELYKLKSPPGMTRCQGGLASILDSRPADITSRPAKLDSLTPSVSCQSDQDIAAASSDIEHANLRFSLGVG
jgi:hypothetical protein